MSRKLCDPADTQTAQLDLSPSFRCKPTVTLWEVRWQDDVYFRNFEDPAAANRRRGAWESERRHHAPNHASLHAFSLQLIYAPDAASSFGSLATFDTRFSASKCILTAARTVNDRYWNLLIRSGASGSQDDARCGAPVTNDVSDGAASGFHL